MARAHVWEFQVQPGRDAEFENHYGPDGSWARLFRQAPGYVGTSLLRDPAQPGRYVTIDHWDSEREYQAFRRAHEQEYEALDTTCRAFTFSERVIGRFDVVAPQAA
jgi:heme-degrading monooxygenase HmoA